MKGIMKDLRILALCSAALLLNTFQAPAQGLIDLPEPADGPDLFSSPLTVSYDYTSMQFLVTGQESAYTYIAGGYDYQTPVIGSFSLTATIDHFGLLTGGTVTAMGDFTGDGETTLLTGNLVTGAKGTAFDYNANKMVFLLTVTGGDFASDYGTLAGIALSPWWGPTPNPFNEWQASFNNMGGGDADTVPYVPEPSSTLLLLIGGVVWSAARRWCR